MSVKLCTAYWKIAVLTRKIKVIPGGQGAGKTYAICEILLRLSIENNNEITTIVTDTYPRLEDGVLADMRNIFADAGLNFAQMYNVQKKNVYLNNGSIIQFRNVDKYNTDSWKGPRRHNLFINEGNRIGWAEIEHAWNRTTKNIFVDYNPDREFWYHENIKSGEFNKSEIDFLVLTYLDNELLDPGELKTILLKKERADLAQEKKEGGKQLTIDENKALLWWLIFGLGQLGTYSDRQIYTYEWCDQIPATAKRIESGMDFGLSPDKTVLVDIWIEYNKLYPKVVFSENNLIPVKLAGAERMSIVDKMDEVGHLKGWPIIADNSGANSIFDMRQHGYNVVSVKKPPGSVMRGISKIRGYDIMLTRDQIELKEAIESYFFKVDRNGNVVPEPDSHEPDSCAALRYGMTRVR